VTLYQTARASQGKVQGYRIEADAMDRAGLRQKIETCSDSMNHKDQHCQWKASARNYKC